MNYHILLISKDTIKAWCFCVMLAATLFTPKSRFAICQMDGGYVLLYSPEQTQAPRLLILDFLTRHTDFLKNLSTFIYMNFFHGLRIFSSYSFILFAIFSRPYVYSRPQVYSRLQSTTQECSPLSTISEVAHIPWGQLHSVLLEFLKPFC